MKKWKRLLFSSLISPLILLFISTNVWAQPKTPWTEKDPSEKKADKLKSDLLNETIVNLAAKLSPAIVAVLTTSEVSVPQMVPDDIFDFFFGMPGQPGRRRQQAPQSRKAQGLGSGFVIHPDGIIVTNSHVVKMGDDRLADSVKVKFLGDSSKNEGVDVEIVGVDPIVDTAVLRLKKKPTQKLAVIPFGNSDQLKVGEWVLAIGNPHGLSHTVTKGIVSALGRDIIPEISADFIQTDASINQGNSGGPLINIAGEVIGVNTAVDPRGQGLGFAIPINTAKRAIRDILAKGRGTHGYAGVSLYPNFDLNTAKSLGLSNAEGALIEDVIPGQPAAKAGLRSYDVVTKIAERKVNTNTDFQKAVRELDPGTSVKVDFIRDGKAQSTQLVLGDLEKDIQAAMPSGRGRLPRYGKGTEEARQVLRVASAGIEIVGLDSSIRSHLGIAPDVKGVVVSGVLSGSAADAAGLARGDIIFEIRKGKEPPIKVDDTKSVERILSKKGSYLVKALRGSTPNLFTLTI